MMSHFLRLGGGDLVRLFLLLPFFWNLLTPPGASSSCRRRARDDGGDSGSSRNPSSPSPPSVILQIKVPRSNFRCFLLQQEMPPLPPHPPPSTPPSGPATAERRPLMTGISASVVALGSGPRSQPR